MGDHSSDEEWSDVEDNEGIEVCETLCIFCQDRFQQSNACLSHMKDVHQFDVIGFCKSNDVDFYGFIRLINFIRAKGTSQIEIKSVKKSDFEDDEFLKPILVDDGLLQVDFEGLIESCVGVSTQGSQNGFHGEDDEKRVLVEKLRGAERRAALAEGNLARAVSAMESCKKEMQRLLLTHSERSADTAVVGKPEGGNAYFESYAHHGIHEEMLKDKVRTEAYKDFILSNSAVFKDKIVLDVGCGTGILSMFAAKAGAKLVIAVDQSDIAYQAMDIIRENNLDDIIKVIKGNAEKIVLPSGVTKVDVIISEWMGYFLLFESMLDSVLRCRDKYLCKGGLVYPDQCGMFLTAVADEELWDAKIKFWDSVYGHKMSCMKVYAVDEPLIEVVKESAVISNPVKIAHFDVLTVKVEQLEFETSFKLEINKDGCCTGLVGFFDISFIKNTQNPVHFSTGCDVPPTHWKQTLFLFEKKVAVLAGETLDGTISCKRDPKDKRALLIDLRICRENIDLVKQRYSLI